MKPFFRGLTFIICCICLNANGQNTHVLTGYDNYFDPDTLYVEPGDTVEFISVGYHSATEIDSIDWENNVANHNGGFYAGFGAPTTDMKFVIDNTGTFYFICVPHAAMGMKGIIISQINVGINDVLQKNVYGINAFSQNLNVQYAKSDELVIIDISGKTLISIPLNIEEEQKKVPFSSLAPGTYIGHFKLKGETIKAIKFIVH